MKKGLILYVTKGKEQFQMRDTQDWRASLSMPGFCALCTAISEDEIAYNWWRLITRGMHEISCITAAYDADSNSLEPHGIPLRLCG